MVDRAGDDSPFAFRVTIPRPGGHAVVSLPLTRGRFVTLALGVRGHLLEVEVVDPPPPCVLERLSSRERQVALLVARGLGNREIAATLRLKPSTVACHLVRIYRKLGLFGRYELVAQIIRGEVLHQHRAPEPARARVGAGC